MRRQGDSDYGIIVVMHGVFVQQPGLRPEPRLVAATVGARGRCPPVEVDRRRGA